MHHRSVKQQPTRSMGLQSCFGSMPKKQPRKVEGKRHLKPVEWKYANKNSYLKHKNHITFEEVQDKDFFNPNNIGIKGKHYL